MLTFDGFSFLFFLFPQLFKIVESILINKKQTISKETIFFLVEFSKVYQMFGRNGCADVSLQSSHIDRYYWREIKHW